MPRVRLVTGYVRLDAYRSHERYVELGNRLLSLPLPITLFADSPDFSPGPTVEVRPAGELWLHRMVGDATPILPQTDRPEKDTLAYHAVQHQKTAWLEAAGRDHPADLLLWVDLGLLHVRGVTLPGIARMAGLAEHLPSDVVTLASIWGPPVDEVDPGRIAWWCAGGVAACGARAAWWWNVACHGAASTLMRMSNRVTFEVNTWAAVWRANPEWFRCYPADHDASILEVA